VCGGGAWTRSGSQQKQLALGVGASGSWRRRQAEVGAGDDPRDRGSCELPPRARSPCRLAAKTKTSLAMPCQSPANLGDRRVGGTSQYYKYLPTPTNGQYQCGACLRWHVGQDGVLRGCSGERPQLGALEEAPHALPSLPLRGRAAQQSHTAPRQHGVVIKRCPAGVWAGRLLKKPQITSKGQQKGKAMGWGWADR